MTAKITASADGLKVTIGNAAEDALEIDQTAKTIKGINGYVLAGNGPAFAATDTATTATAGATVQVVFDTELFDTDNTFDGTTFQPLVAGYYQVNVSVAMGVNTLASSVTATLRKNGATHSTSFTSNVAGFGTVAIVSDLVFMNGTTDTLDVQGRNSGNANLGVSRFSASLVRAA